MTRRPHSLRRLAVVAVLMLTAGCGAGDDPGGTAPDPEVSPTQEAGPARPQVDGEDPDEGVAADVLVEITDFTYVLPDLVPPGAEVAVTNSDSVGHTVTSDDGVFDVAVDPGDTVTFTAPEEPGEYGFHCIPHPHMTATLVVG